MIGVVMTMDAGGVMGGKVGDGGDGVLMINGLG